MESHAIEGLFQELKGMNFHLGVEGISFFRLPTAGKTDLSRLPAGTGALKYSDL